MPCLSPSRLVKRPLTGFSNGNAKGGKSADSLGCDALIGVQASAFETPVVSSSPDLRGYFDVLILATPSSRRGQNPWPRLVEGARGRRSSRLANPRHRTESP